MATERLLPPRRRRWFYALAIAGFLLYAAWILGPYVRSIIVRDAAVTTWSQVATTPIDGTVHFAEHSPGGTVGPDELIATVRNEHASRQAVEEARGNVVRAEARIAELELQLEEIKSLDEERQSIKALYAETFRDQLDVRILNLEQRVEIARSLLALVSQIAERKSTLVAKGVGSPNDADEAQLRVRQAAFDLASLEAELAFAKVRREAADHGVFSMDEGDDPGWAQGARMELKIEKKATRLQLREAMADLENEKVRLASAEADLERLSQASITAPPGSIVWSEHVASGTAVLQGEAVVEWLDCGILLVDVPVSDVEVALLQIGQPAVVLLEGESTERAARVIQVRGAASTLGRDDLVALAKGRGEGTAQALLELVGEGATFASCPVGRAAFVDFPDIGLLDVILARLRL